MYESLVKKNLYGDCILNEDGGYFELLLFENKLLFIMRIVIFNLATHDQSVLFKIFYTKH